MLNHWTADVLVSDIGMPDEDGYSLIEKVRKLTPQTQRAVPAVALTANARSEDRSSALAAGFQVHMAKPVDPAELTRVIGQLFAVRGDRSHILPGIPGARSHE
jgi:CheY-like chemotaxis protein